MSSFRNKRIQSDIKNLYNNPIENVFFHVNEDDMTNLQFMIIGPENTPYHLGFFIFGVGSFFKCCPIRIWIPRL